MNNGNKDYFEANRDPGDDGIHYNKQQTKREPNKKSTNIEYYWDEYNNEWRVEYEWSPQERYARDMGWDG